MKSYVQGRVFPKYWGWFEAPHEVKGFAAATFLSYEKVDALGFRRKETLTSVIDLSESLETVFSRMRKSFIRKQIEQGKRRGIVVEKSDDFASFYPLYSAFSKKMNFERVPKSTLAGNGILFIAKHEGKILAGGVFIGDGVDMRAWVLASLRVGNASGRERDMIGEANRMIIEKALMCAKEAGYRQFDLGGIAPDAENAGWRAVAVFKEAFGGVRIPAYYYHKVYSPLSRMIAKLRRFVPI